MKINNFFIPVLIPILIFGHRINIFATVEGNKIYTQSYASDGRKIKGGTIEVYDKDGKKILTGITDSLGEFSFVIPKKDDLKIVVRAGMGHRAETIISAEDLPEIRYESKEKIPSKQKKEDIPIPKTEVIEIDTFILKRMIEDILDTKLHPLLKQISEQKKEQVKFTEVIGGIGYIVGILGIIAFFMSRKKNV